MSNNYWWQGKMVVFMVEILKRVNDGKE